MKPALIANRTLEPTQVAGFNQLFDDPSGTKSTRYGVGVDWQPMRDLSLGAEATWRDLDEPVLLDEADYAIENRDERYHRLYLYWTPTLNLAVSAAFVYDTYQSERGRATDFNERPEKVTTYSLPLVVSYFLPSGAFASLGGNYVDQTVKRSDSAFLADGEDNFFLVDAAIGFRFPKRAGMVSLGVRNLFDQEFQYQDDSFREFSQEASTGPYFPQRVVMGQLSMSF